MQTQIGVSWKILTEGNIDDVRSRSNKENKCFFFVNGMEDSNSFKFVLQLYTISFEEITHKPTSHEQLFDEKKETFD